MPKINLRDFYPNYYSKDFYFDISTELSEIMLRWEREERSYSRTKRRFHVYSLDCEDGLERLILFRDCNPMEEFERKLTLTRIHAAILSLPEIQKRRIYAHYFLNLSKTEISKIEKVSKSVVGTSIRKGLIRIRETLKDME